MREREKKGEKNAQEKRIWKRNEKWRARERPLTRKRARNRGLDSKDLSGKKRLDSKDVNVERTTMTREARIIQEKELQQETRAVGAHLH